MKSRKVRLIAGVSILVVALTIVVVWLIRDGSVESQGSQPVTIGAASSDLAAETVEQLVAKLSNTDPTIYRTVWVHEEETPPMPPTGTTIAIDPGTVRSVQDYGRIDAVVTMPNEGAVRSVIHFQKIGGQWRIHHVERMK